MASNRQIFIAGYQQFVRVFNGGKKSVQGVLRECYCNWFCVAIRKPPSR